MEVDAMKEMFSRSEKLLDIKHVNYIGDDLTTYYGLAIRRHPESACKMKDAIWATFYHKCSTGKDPQHSKCPEGADSWCKWRVAEARKRIGFI
ncbi:hypothetical protein J437_LFUL006955 [Ladona fulva]|uniref:Uncharacterized protein n=1 Tax=Ladona fulva TaxID=123851 RepID=A0A8K0KBU4_LADFU|nr:hypothetical protein J437_LFUL006955 [Ladona fulva]